MSWLLRILVGLGIALALVIVIVLVIGNWRTGGDQPTQALSMTVGNRTITVAGHYKDMTQESVGEGIKINVDGHEISLAADQLTVDGKTEVIEPDQDVMVYVAEDGKALYLTLKLEGAQAVDALLVPEPVGKNAIDTFTKQAGPVTLSAPLLLNEPVSRGTLWKRYVSVPKGRYYLVLDNSAAAGQVAPPAGPADGQSARTDVLVLVGDKP